MMKSLIKHPFILSVAITRCRRKKIGILIRITQAWIETNWERWRERSYCGQFEERFPLGNQNEVRFFLMYDFFVLSRRLSLSLVPEDESRGCTDVAAHLHVSAHHPGRELPGRWWVRFGTSTSNIVSYTNFKSAARDSSCLSLGNPLHDTFPTVFPVRTMAVALRWVVAGYADMPVVMLRRGSRSLRLWRVDDLGAWF